MKLLLHYTSSVKTTCYQCLENEISNKTTHTYLHLNLCFYYWHQALVFSHRMISEFVSLPCWHSWDWKIPCLSLWERGVLSLTLSLGLSAISAKTFVTWVIISGVLMGSEPRERRRKWEREAEGEGGVWLVWFLLTEAWPQAGRAQRWKE